MDKKNPDVEHSADLEIDDGKFPFSKTTYQCWIPQSTSRKASKSSVLPGKSVKRGRSIGALKKRPAFQRLPSKGLGRGTPGSRAGDLRRPARVATGGSSGTPRGRGLTGRTARLVRRAHRHGPHPAPRGRVEKGLRAFALAISRGGYGRDVDGDRAHGASPRVVQRLPEGTSRLISRLRRLASEPGPRTARPRAARATVGEALRHGDRVLALRRRARGGSRGSRARAPPSLTSLDFNPSLDRRARASAKAAATRTAATSRPAPPHRYARLHARRPRTRLFPHVPVCARSSSWTKTQRGVDSRSARSNLLLTARFPLP